ncbi:(deoxy)nucleoside triphosphate pyrophosphohydrolase [Microbacterium sp.]|uniref:(deoxy)nucleoside triphosphate pyrophosphohydrolase n=1 Tax=Microbacterium sp. TaxID=51671 RepID=UPI0037C4F0AB
MATQKQLTVVGAVIVREGMVLCAKRGPAGPLASRWEFPGGKVERGEAARDALAREISEELKCAVDVGSELTTTTYHYDFAAVTLTTFWCELTSGVPQLTEHAEVRWLRPSELESLDWAPADIPAVRLIVASGVAA